MDVLAGKIKQSNVQYNEDYTYELLNKYFNEKVNIHEVLQIINNLKDNTAAGSVIGNDGVKVKMLNSVAKYIVKSLIYLYNLNIAQCIFLEKFKLAIIKLLFKNGYRTEVSNYRPISMLSN